MKRAVSAKAGLALAGFLISCPAFAERLHPRAGTSSAPFLKIGAGARPVGMGESFTALADDVYALYWNPAGLTGLDRPNFGATHQEAYQGLNHEYFGYAQPLMLRDAGAWRRAGHKAAWGLSLSILSVPGNLERRSEETTSVLSQITTPQGTFGAADMAFGASGAFEYERHSLGATVKLVRQAIDNHTAHGGAVDLGWIRRDAFIPNLSFGAAVLNLGPGIRFSENWYPLPLTLKAGAGYRLDRWRTRMVADVSAPRDDFATFAFGGEVGLREYLFFRAGYRQRWHGNPNGSLSGFRSGLGFVYKNLSLDYAVAPFGELGNSHRFSLGLKFGGPGPAAHGGKSSPPPAPPPAPVVALPPAAPVLQESGMAEYAIKSTLRTASARGSDYAFDASALDPTLTIRRIEFRATIPGPQGVAIAAGEATSHPPLPEGVKAVKVWVLRCNVPRPRGVFISVDPAAGETVWGLFEGAWKELASEVRQEGETRLVRASSDRMPEALAVGSAP